MSECGSSFGSRKAGRCVRAILGLAAFALPVGALAREPVQTQNGLLLPTDAGEAGVEVFKGVPYAAAPVGDLRWKPPQPPAAWDGVRVADKLGPPCFQGHFPGVTDPRPASEDCLTLNVWRPAQPDQAKLPVMVWIHGGAFVAGSNVRMDGAPLAGKGVVLVAINYRLGPLGFFTHPELTAESPHDSSGNYALLDAVMALEWVRDNIANFGGDPENVTIFGQSAGSELVNILTVSPLAKGLFAKAIGESGGSMGWREPRKLSASEQLGLALADKAGAKSAMDLRAIAPEQLFELSGREFEPVIDGWSYPTPQRAALRQGLQHRVPMMVGSTADEGQFSSTLTAERYVADMERRYGAKASDLLHRFPGTDDGQARQSNKDYITLGTEFIERTIADEHARVAPAYQYRFIHAPPASAGGEYSRNLKGAYHASELPYVFATLGKEPRDWKDVDRNLERAMSSYWVNFARTGNPNGPGLPHWPDVQSAPRKVLQFGEKVELIDRPHEDAVRFFEEFYYGNDGVHGDQ